MAKNKLTREQHLAFARDRHISVTANAGSGKTTVLIDKFIDILLNDEKTAKDPTRILAITFTRVAASEMFIRAAKAIDKFIAGETEHTNLKTLYEVRDKLSYAKITTIHSFCSGLLRDYPIEAGIPPNFTEISEFDKAKLKEDALESVFERKLSADNPDNSYRNLFDVYGLKTIRTFMDSVITKPDIFELIKKIYEQSNEELLSFYNETTNNYLLDLVYDIQHFEAQVNVYPEKEANRIKYEAAQEEMDEIVNEMTSKKMVDHNDLVSFLSVLSSKVGQPSFFGYIKKQTGYVEELDEIKEKLTVFSKSLTNLDNMLLIQTARMIIELADDFFVEFGALKDEIGCIDFDDMIFKVRDMLKDEEVAKRVRDEFDYILVDEFQDTNIAQYDIIKALVPSLENPTAEMDLRCFIVGDGKQSIYAFRGADVRVFNRAIENIKAFNKDKITKGKLSEDYMLPDGAGFNSKLSPVSSTDENEKLGALNLSCSFRLLPVPAAFVNFVMNQIEPRTKSDYNIKYEDLVCGREIDRLFAEHIESEEETIEMDKQFGTVSVLLNLVEKKDTAEQNLVEPEETADQELGEQEPEGDSFSMMEAEMIARHIAKIVRSDSEYSLFKDGENHKPQYGDVAVLSRNRKGFSPLVTAFLNHRIPYNIQSGKGFFSSQEIMDIGQFLVFLSNERDDLAIVSILKSPFFGFCNEDLYEISLSGRRGECFYHKFLAYSASITVASANYDKVHRTIAILELMQFYSTRIPISSLITKIIDSGGYWGVVANSPAGSQIEANFEKLVQYARTFELKGFKTLNDFIDELNHLAESSGEAEAVNQTGENAVQIVTVHGAKGAEFPIVYLYATNFSRHRETEPFLDDKTGLIFSLKSLDSAVVTKEPLPMGIIAKENLITAAMAEERRTLYVALTRARDHLIITGEMKENQKNGYRKPAMYLAFIFRALGLSPLTHIKPDLNMSIKNEMKQKVLHNGKFISLNISFDVLITAEKISIYDSDSVQLESPQLDLMLEPIEGSFSDGFYSASRLKEFENDPEKFIIKSYLGLVDDDEIDLKIQTQEAKQKKSNLYGATPGTVIHETMEQISKWLGTDGAIDYEVLQSTVDSKMKRHDLGQADELRDRILQECIATAETSFIQKNAGNLQTARAELDLTMPIGGDYLNGAIDCFIETESGDYEVWDWKSNRINNDEDLQRLKEYYRFQMDTYALLLMLLKPGKDQYTCRLLFTNRAATATKDEDWTVSFNYKPSDIEPISDRLKELISGTRLA